MAVTLVDSGSHTPTNSMATLVTDVPAGGVYVMRVDLEPMQNGDTVRIYTTGHAGLAPHIVSEETFTDDQGDVAAEFVIVLDEDDSNGAVMLQQSAGTYRTFGWRLIQIGA